MAYTEIHSTTLKTIAFLYQQLQLTKFAIAQGISVDIARFGSAELTMSGGVVSQGLDTIWTLIIEESDDGVVFAPVDNTFLIGDQFAITDSNQEISIGYIGKKRFVRPSIQLSGGSILATIDSIGVTLIGANSRHVPFAPLAV